jgi:ribosome-associated heat shock protein Hsp15
MSDKGSRLDKWLWATRVFKTRTQATDACKSGHVKINDQTVKPAHEVKVGEVISIKLGVIEKTVKVLGMLERRVSASVAKTYIEDLTPPEEYQKLRRPEYQPVFFRPKGSGRPSKKDRRDLQKLL